MSQRHAITAHGQAGFLVGCACGAIVDSFLDHLREAGVKPRVRYVAPDTLFPTGYERPWKVFTPELGSEMQYPTWGEAIAWALLDTEERDRQITEAFEMEADGDSAFDVVDVDAGLAVDHPRRPSGV